MSMEDFIPDTYHKLSDVSITGISSALSVQGHGTVRYVIHDDTGTPIDLEIEKVLYIPELPIRLISPQQVAHQTRGLNDGLQIGPENAYLPTEVSIARFNITLKIDSLC